MAKIEILQDIQIKKAKPQEKEYFLNDGGGLRLLVKENGSKIWQFRYTLNGQRKKTSFKTYPTVSLKEARIKKQEYQELINKGIDPINNAKQIKKENIADINGMFLNVADEWLEKEAKEIKNSTHTERLRIFNKDIKPSFKDKHIKNIEIQDVTKIIEVKAIQSIDTASKMFNYLNRIFAYAKIKGYCNSNILYDIKKRDIFKSRKVRHYPKITNIKILEELVKSIYTYKGTHSIRNALRLLLHIPFRAENLCNLKWDYINFDEKLLSIPRELMKMTDYNFDDFKIPLTEEAIIILKEQQMLYSNQVWVFPGQNNAKPINNESPNKALKIMGYNDEKNGRKITLHGFRGTFRSIIETLDIENKFSFEVKERALDHQETSPTVRAYTNEVNYVPQLVPLMNFWSDFIIDLKNRDLK